MMKQNLTREQPGSLACSFVGWSIQHTKAGLNTRKRVLSVRSQPPVRRFPGGHVIPTLST